MEKSGGVGLGEPVVGRRGRKEEEEEGKEDGREEREKSLSRNIVTTRRNLFTRGDDDPKNSCEFNMSFTGSLVGG